MSRIVPHESEDANDNRQCHPGVNLTCMVPAGLSREGSNDLEGFQIVFGDDVQMSIASAVVMPDAVVRDTQVPIAMKRRCQTSSSPAAYR